ncbi:putative Ig domain-containing protein [Nonomuraea sp. NPDC050556]|uniref:putative Ig domain-containing protein n=1 Tax=Nonomuraea sp. NPDC050556 TaxID=3364369 RepID=UPI00378C2ACA
MRFLLGLAVALTVIASPASAAPPDPVLAAMKRDLGLSTAQVQSLWSAEAGARNIARSLPFDRSALWFENGSLFVAVTDDAQAAQVRAAGAQPKLVARGPAALAAVAAAITPAPGVSSWGVDAASDSVVVTVTPQATDRVRQSLTALSPAVRLVESAATQTQQGGDVVGGESWKPGTESQCSIGFSATGQGGSRHFLTAGHCTNDANQAAYGKDGTRLGTSNVGGNHSVNAEEGDFGLVDVTEASWNLAARVSGYGSGDATVTGSSEPTVGMSICHSGANTQWRCGTITKVNQRVDYGNVVVGGLFITNACSGGGDSGGSYVTGPKDNALAVGLHSGGGNPCGQSDPNTNAQPVVEALGKWQLSLLTSTPQPGAPSVANPGNRTSVVNTPVSLANSASGGSAPYTWTASGLPAGLSIDQASGTISGTPTATGTSTVTVTASDTAAKSGSATFTWTVTGTGGGTPTLTNPGYQNAYIGRPFSLQLTATGGTQPYAWTATGLPPGLSLGSTTGVISGKATTWGLYNSTITLTDAAGRTASVKVGWSIWS